MSNIPPNWYQQQADTAAEELDLDLADAACGLGESYDSQLFNLNAILDAVT